ncbi:hypothetical protein N7509_002497 [Penicillium cosmopolitanum]|uniref:A to I editase domain-containing protein n=1 Tax=Penicillium cosmopolitanum TaxID=1131564 RepID=A0A9X0BDJ1_9EURO|nr:uncharacterized protein N7509_002497 [Penicillium cosmopolitanum]KAJ5408614.1 hypothetical protein N7509_002497 [Penicillium cosmopolitanum]
MSKFEDPVPLSSRIASLVHAHFDALPTRSKPSIFPDGSREWIPMTGIVIVAGENTSSESLHCITITSGAKCLSASHIPHCRGLVLHDCHAEILAIRAFNHWLLTECHALLAEERTAEENADSVCENRPTSPFIRRREGKYHDKNASIKWPPFELQPDIKIYMYCTCAPCGDASMELCMASQEDATPWEVMQEQASNTEESEGKMLDGRAHFSLLGVVRRKPARMDAESTRSKSCSDKLALRQVSSLLSCETSSLVAPTESAYLAGLILPEDEISRSGCERSFGENGRMKALAGRSWSGSSAVGDTAGYRFRPFQVLSVPVEQIESQWRFSKIKRDDSSLSADGSEESKSAVVSKKNRPSNVSAIWTAAPSYSHTCAALADTGSKSLPALNKTKTGLYENVINGVKQGNRATTPLARGASSLSRAKLWGLVRNVIQPSACHGPPSPLQEELSRSEVDRVDHGSLSVLQRHVVQSTTYDEFKRAIVSSTDPNQVRADAMNDAKAVLKGWVANSGDENWGLDVLIDPQKRKR